MAEETLQGNSQDVAGPGAVASPALPQVRVPTANIPDTVPTVGGDQDKDVDVDVISAQFLKHWLERTPPPPGSQPSPGSFGDKLRNAINQVGKGLGDAAAATDQPVPEGAGGALTGITRTLRARGERLDKERKETQENYEFRQRVAINNLNMANMVQRIKTASTEAKNASFDREKAYVSQREKDGYDVVHGLTESQVKAEMDGYSDDQKRHYGEVYDLRHVGETTVNGKTVPMFDRITREHRPVEVTPEIAADFKRLGVKDIPQGTRLPYETYEAYHNAANTVQQNHLALATAYGAELAQNLKNSGMEAETNPYVQNGITQNPADPITGLQDEADHIDALIDYHKQMLDAANQVQNMNPAAKKELQDYMAELQKGKAAIQSFLATDVTKEMMETNRKIQEDADKYDLGQKKLEIQRENVKLKQAAVSGSDDDMRSAAQDIVNGLGDPSQLPKRGKNYETIIRYAKEYSQKQFGVPFDWAQSQTDFHYANQRTTKDTLNMIRATTEHNGSLEIVQDKAALLPQLNSKLINEVFNKVAGSFGDQRITDFQTALLGFADEYAKVMGGGVASDTARQQALDLLKDGYSKGQFKGAFAVLRADLDARARGIVGKNRYLWKEYGEDFNMGPWAPKAAYGRGVLMPHSISEAQSGRSSGDYKKVSGEEDNYNAGKALATEAPASGSTPAAGAPASQTGAATAPAAQPSATTTVPGAFQRPPSVPKQYTSLQQLNNKWYWVNPQTKKGIEATPDELKQAGVK